VKGKTMSICKDCHTEEIVLEDGTPCCMGTVRKWEVIHGVFPWKYSPRRTQLAPDAKPAGAFVGGGYKGFARVTQTVGRTK
jgi:hypothetical protein